MHTVIPLNQYEGELMNMQLTYRDKWANEHRVTFFISMEDWSRIKGSGPFMNFCHLQQLTKYHTKLFSTMPLLVPPPRKL